MLAHGAVFGGDDHVIRHDVRETVPERRPRIDAFALAITAGGSR